MSNPSAGELYFAFLEAVLAAPEDDLPRLALADFLEDRNCPAYELRMPGRWWLEDPANKTDEKGLFWLTVSNSRLLLPYPQMVRPKCKGLQSEFITSSAYAVCWAEGRWLCLNCVSELAIKCEGEVIISRCPPP